MTQAIWTANIIKQEVPAYAGPKAGPAPLPVACRTGSDASALPLFRLFLPNSTLKLLLVATNENGKARYKKWKDIKDLHLLSFIGALFVMGIANCRDTRQYWQSDIGPPLLRTFWSRDMFLRVFGALAAAEDDVTAPGHGAAPRTAEQSAAAAAVEREMRANATALPDHSNRLCGVRRFTAEMNVSFQKYWICGGHTVIDESMIKFRGMHPSVQHLPRKPIRIGFKAFTLATPSGYALRQWICPGGEAKDTKTKRPAAAAASAAAGAVHVEGLLRPLKATERLVLGLHDIYDGAYRVLTMDSYFSSPAVAWLLLQRQTLVVAKCVGTRADFPASLATAVARVGVQTLSERQCADTPALRCIAWNEKGLRTAKARQLFVCTALSQPAHLVIHTVTRRAVRKHRAVFDKFGRPTAAAAGGAGGTGGIAAPAAAAAAGDDERKTGSAGAASVVKKKVSRPSVAVLYGRDMAGADVSNRIAALRSPWRRSQRWVVCVIIHYLKVAAGNAWLLYRAVGGQKPFGDFFLLLARSLITKKEGNKRRGRELHSGMRPAVVAHSPQREAKGAAPRQRGRCAVCQGGGQQIKGGTDTRAKTSYFCVTCSTPAARVWLCNPNGSAAQQACWAAHTAAAHRLAQPPNSK